MSLTQSPSSCAPISTAPAPQAKALPREALAAHVAGLLLRLSAGAAAAVTPGAPAGPAAALELQQLRQALRCVGLVRRMQTYLG